MAMKIELNYIGIMIITGVHCVIQPQNRLISGGSLCLMRDSLNLHKIPTEPSRMYDKFNRAV